MTKAQYTILFKSSTSTRKVKDGYKCFCKKGLWGVYAPTRKQAVEQGEYYFYQYYTDGEYNE